MGAVQCAPSLLRTSTRASAQRTNELSVGVGVIHARTFTPARTVQENTRIKSFHVDASLPTALFETIYREAKKEKKGKKGKKKKK